MRSLTLLPILFAGACGGSNGGEPPDAADPAGGGPTIKISGKAMQVPALTAIAGAKINAYASSNETTALATATTAADGTYTLTVPGGMALDGYLKGSLSGNIDTYLYSPTPITTDFGQANINMVATGTYGLINSVGPAQATDAMIVLLVVDSATSLTLVKGAVVTSDPVAKATAYTGALLPQPSTEGTKDDGTAFLIGLTPGMVTVSATKSGVTFKPTTVKARANAFTTTLITQ
jgi:hypothetical protein